MQAYKKLYYVYNKEKFLKEVYKICNFIPLKLQATENKIISNKVYKNQDVNLYYEKNCNLRKIKYIEKFLRYFSLNAKDNTIHVIVLKPGKTIPKHYDYDRKCAINIPLTDNCIINFKSKKVKFNMPILVNTFSYLHSVTNITNSNRVIVSISLYDEYTKVLGIVQRLSI